MATVALTLVMATSVGLLILGRRYVRGYLTRHGTLPPGSWMFRRSEDPDLESMRRLALALLPVYLIAAALYLLGPDG